MSCLIWNGRGLGNPKTIRELHDLSRLEVPALVFVSETKIDADRVRSLTSRLGFAGCVPVASDGLSGGLVLFWSREVGVTVQTVSDQHIDVEVVNVGGDNKTWRFTDFYVKERRRERASS